MVSTEPSLKHAQNLKQKTSFEQHPFPPWTVWMRVSYVVAT
jgi:hypothetical protein